MFGNCGVQPVCGICRHKAAQKVNKYCI